MNCSKQTLINSQELPMVPRAFVKEYFKGFWDELSEVSQLAHDMKWLVLGDPAVLAGLSLAGGWLCWLETVHWGAFSLQLRQIMLSFNSWGKCQSGIEDSIRALAPNRTTTSELEQHCSTQLISCWSFTHLFEKKTSHALPTKGTYISHSRAFFHNWGKEKSVKTVKIIQKNISDTVSMAFI